MANTKASDIQRLLQELEVIKRLLIAGLARDGLTQRQLASVLGVTQPSVSRMFPQGLPKPAPHDGPASDQPRKRKG